MAIFYKSSCIWTLGVISLFSAIAYEKHLRKLAEKVICHFQKGLNAVPEESQLKDVMPVLIKDFKDAISEMYKPVCCANQKEVWKSIKILKQNAFGIQETMMMTVRLTQHKLWSSKKNLSTLMQKSSSRC